MVGDDLRDGEDRLSSPRDLLADLPGHAGDAAAFQAEVVRGATGFRAALFRSANPRTSAMLIAAMRKQERDGVL